MKKTLSLLALMLIVSDSSVLTIACNDDKAKNNIIILSTYEKYSSSDKSYKR